MLDEKDEINAGRRSEQCSISDGEEGRASAGGAPDIQAPEGDCEAGCGGALGEEGQIYFIETEDKRFVKIGYSVQPLTRMSQLGTLRPGEFKLRLLGYMPGSYATERWLHQKFADLRDAGEWFSGSPALRCFIEALGLIQPIIVQPQRHIRSVRAQVMTDDTTMVANKMTIPSSMICKCLRCRAEWVKRIGGRPKRCPSCKQRNWDVPKGGVRRGRPKKGGKAGK